MKFLSNSVEQTEEIGRKLALKLSKKDIIAFSGDLGAGKTAFSRGILNGLGYENYVTSPTFAIVNEYFTEKFTVYHFDMYRILDEDSLYEIGFDDYLNSNGILIIEWSENVINFLPKDIILIDIKHLGDENREISIGGKYENISL